MLQSPLGIETSVRIADQQPLKNVIMSMAGHHQSAPSFATFAILALFCACEGETAEIGNAHLSDNAYRNRQKRILMRDHREGRETLA